MRGRASPALALALCAGILLPGQGRAAPAGRNQDPDWPCQQIKVPELSLAAIWSGPAVDTTKSSWEQDPAIADLARRIAERREPVESAASAIHDFAQAAGPQKQAKLLSLLAGVFSVMDEERSSVLAGLDRFGRRQRELADQIRADAAALRELQTKPDADANAVAQLTQKVTWATQVFDDRRQEARYACDVPSKIEQRLFSLARAIEKELG